jgi:aryl-alcohol dehydrogenase-like predicted oxidoreductase
LARQGIGYLAYSPLGFGLLSGALGPDATFHPRDWRGRQRAGSTEEGVGPFSPGSFERNLERVERLRSVAERLGIPVSSLALAWVAHQVGVTAAIAGSRNSAHVRSNAAAGDVTLDTPTHREIDSIFGPE